MTDESDITGDSGLTDERGPNGNPSDEVAGGGRSDAVTVPRRTSNPSPSRTSRAARRKRRNRRRALFALVVVVILVALPLGGWLWYSSQLGAASGPHTTVELVIPRGTGNAGIGEILARNSVIKNATAFAWHTRLKGSGPFEAGNFRFTTNLSVDDAIAVLAKGPVIPKIVKVTIPEGFRVDEIVERIHRDVPRFSTVELRKVLDSGAIVSPLLPPGTHDYEGLLFPATYDVGEKTTVTGLLQKMADTLADRVSTMGLEAGASQLAVTPYKLVIVASLVQAEAGNPDEAPKIARVIYNRLAKGEPLGIDATSRYLSIISGDPVDFESTSPYNSRRNPGLPPTPIASPGDVALQAALHPAPGDWLWYVRDVNNDAQGRPQHVFTSSAAEFEQAKRACHDAGLGCGAS